MTTPNDPVDPTVVWQAEGIWAAQRWRTLFDAKHDELRRHDGYLSNSRYYVASGVAAKHAFEQTADVLLQRIRNLLASRTDPDHIGNPDQCAPLIVRPMKLTAVARIRKLSSAGTGQEQEIETRAKVFIQTTTSEFRIRLDEIGNQSSRRIDKAVIGDFVAFARSALADGHKDVAAVLAAAALEDCLKRYCIRHAIIVERKSMQHLVGALKGKGLVTGAQKSLLDTMPKLRDYAMHANWKKIDAPSVNGMIGYVEQFLADHFA